MDPLPPSTTHADRLSPARIMLAAGVMILAAISGRPAAQADDLGRFSALEENDSLYFNSDKHYTQGLRFAYLAPDLRADSGWNGPFDLLSGLAFENGSRVKRRYAVFVGQSIFTPRDIDATRPDPTDRPYAGWLYLGTSLLQENARRSLENLEIDLGVVGPSALAKQAQNDFHDLLSIHRARGWGYELRDEPGLMLSYEKAWRLPVLGDGIDGLDVVPQAGATVGNVMTYGQLGGLVRFGHNLQADYGPVRIRPALSGTDYFDADAMDGNFGYYIFAGLQGRVVGRNIFLDGNSFQNSASVDANRLVADLEAGLSLFWSSRFRLDFAVMRRTPEFSSQHTPDILGTAALAFSF